MRDNGLEGQASVRLASGLGAIEPGDGITAVSICGMGGETIRDILESGKAHLGGHERLVLQPNGGEQPLRQWLADNGYRIVAEEVLRENRFGYEIIVAERGEGQRYSPEQLYFGPLLMAERSPAFVFKWQRMLRQKQQALANFALAKAAVPVEEVEAFERELGWINAVLG